MTAQQQYEMLRKELNEQQWRWYLGTEALKIGSGGISQVANLSGADWKTVQRGVKELKGERARAQISHQEDGSGRLAPRARLFAQGQQENAGRRFSCRPRSTVWAHHALCKQFEQKQAPAISVECKKKELLGTFKNQGREWQPKGQETRVNVYDYRSLAAGKAIRDARL